MVVRLRSLALVFGALGHSVFFSFNGGTSTRTIPLTGTAANGDVFVIA